MYLDIFENRCPATNDQVKVARDGFRTRLFMRANAEGHYYRKFASAGILARVHVDESGIIICFQQLPILVRPNFVFLDWPDVTYSKKYSKRYFNPFELRRRKYHVYESERANFHIGFNDEVVEKYADFFIGADKMPSDFEPICPTPKTP